MAKRQSTELRFWSKVSKSATNAVADCPVCGLPPDNKRACCPPVYPCEKCGKPRTKAEGGTVFTVCDECWDGPEEVKTMVVSWRVEHYRVKGLEVFPAFDSHIYDPVVMLKCTHCLKAYGAENIATIPRHRESLEAEIKALKAERDYCRTERDIYWHAWQAEKAEVARLEGLIVAEACNDGECITIPHATSICAEARAIKARKAKA